MARTKQTETKEQRARWLETERKQRIHNKQVRAQAKKSVAAAHELKKQRDQKTNPDGGEATAKETHHQSHKEGKPIQADPPRNHKQNMPLSFCVKSTIFKKVWIYSFLYFPFSS